MGSYCPEACSSASCASSQASSTVASSASPLLLTARLRSLLASWSQFRESKELHSSQTFFLSLCHCDQERQICLSLKYFWRQKYARLKFRPSCQLKSVYETQSSIKMFIVKAILPHKKDHCPALHHYDFNCKWSLQCGKGCLTLSPFKSL